MTLQIEEWLQPDGWLSFAHQSQEDHLKPFEDVWDHMGIWLTQEYLNGTKTIPKIRSILERGLQGRFVGGKFLRHSTSTTPMNLDQLDFMYPLMVHVGMKTAADAIVKQCNEFMLPHKSDHFHFKTSSWGRMFEVYDALFDKTFSSSEVSSMNNIARLLWHSYVGHRNRKAVDVLKSWRDPYWVIVVYGARRPEDGAGKSKEERKKIFDEICKNAVALGPSEKSPPPIYLGYEKIIAKYL